jgi:sugar phosphate isomerase/epimerase
MEQGVKYMSKLKIAAQMYTLRDFIKTYEDMAATFKRVKEIGYNAIQLSACFNVEPQRIKELADKENLDICATHISYDRLKNDIEAVIKEHKLWCCKYVGIGAMPEEYRGDAKGIKAFAVEASEIGRRLNASGLKLISHNHKFEFEKFDGLTGMDILLNESDPEALDFEIDTYWVQAGGANPVDWIRKVSGRMDVIHFKDMGIIRDQQVYAEIGEGNLDWPAILKTCESTNVIWAAIEQDECARNPFDSLEISLRNLEKMM